MHPSTLFYVESVRHSSPPPSVSFLLYVGAGATRRCGCWSWCCCWCWCCFGRCRNCRRCWCCLTGHVAAGTTLGSGLVPFDLAVIVLRRLHGPRFLVGCCVGCAIASPLNQLVCDRLRMPRTICTREAAEPSRLLKIKVPRTITLAAISSVRVAPDPGTHYLSGLNALTSHRLPALPHAQ